MDKEIITSITKITENIKGVAKNDFSAMIKIIDDLNKRVTILENKNRMTFIDVIKLIINIGNFILLCILAYIFARR